VGVAAEGCVLYVLAMVSSKSHGVHVAKWSIGSTIAELAGWLAAHRAQQYGASNAYAADYNRGL
jgi:hypothetical protein